MVADGRIAEHASLSFEARERLCDGEIWTMSEQDDIHRTHLPIPDQPHVGLTTYDAKDPDTKYPPIRELRPPKGAPNVLIVLIDDVGFGATSVFGGPCHTPNFEKLAADGLKYNRFHTTALCSPTRQPC
jgi:Sulfatase